MQNSSKAHKYVTQDSPTKVFPHVMCDLHGISWDGWPWGFYKSSQSLVLVDHGTSKCFIIYFVIYLGGQTCRDTPKYHIWLHSNPLNTQSKIYPLSWLYLVPFVAYYKYLTHLWRIHRWKHSIWNIPDDFLLLHHIGQWNFSFLI